MDENAMDLKQVQDVLYNLLCVTVDFCDANGIETQLFAGTLLGAIRHNGFIPWDDDVDIIVPRKDYERLKEIVHNGGFKHPCVELKLPGDEGYPYPFIKAYDTRTKMIDEGKFESFDFCMNIDVFPMDHFSDNPFIHRAYIFTTMVWRAALAVELVEKNLNLSAPVKAVATGINKISGGYRNICKIMDRRAARMNRVFKKSHYAGDGPWLEQMTDRCITDGMYPLKKHIFVDREFSIPANYDEILRSYYGDYMTPPPDNEKARHHFKAYWRQ